MGRFARRQAMATCGDLFGGDLYEEEQAVELAKYVESLEGSVAEGEEMSAYVQKIHNLNENGSFAELLDDFIPKLQGVFKQGSEDDVAGAYSICFALCRKMSEAQQAGYTTKLAESVTCSQEDGEVRLKMLANLYNSVHPSFGKMRHSVFVALLEYCTATDQTSKIAKHLGGLEARVTSWKLSKAEQKAFYLQLASNLESYKNGELSQKFLATYLSLWEAKDNLAEAAPQAIVVSVNAIQNATTFGCDELLRLPAVAALKTGDDKAQVVHRLLEIYSREKLEDYENYVKGKVSTLEALGLSHDTCVDKLRMLSLASLAADLTEIPYDLVKSTLKLDSDKEVEAWVIKVHRAGLVKGKMDQLRRLVVVNRTTARVFSTTDWAELKTRVDGWRQCLTSMSDVIQAAKVHASS